MTNQEKIVRIAYEIINRFSTCSYEQRSSTRLTMSFVASLTEICRILDIDDTTAALNLSFIYSKLFDKLFDEK